MPRALLAQLDFQPVGEEDEQVANMLEIDMRAPNFVIYPGPSLSHFRALTAKSPYSFSVFESLALQCVSAGSTDIPKRKASPQVRLD